MSLLAALQCTGYTHLITPPSPIAAVRATTSLAAGAQVILVGQVEEPLHYTLQVLVDAGKIEWLQRDFDADDVLKVGRPEVDGIVDAVFVTAKKADVTQLSQICRRHRIPLNVLDNPSQSTLTLLSVHTTGPLQIGITTNGSGCKLSSRIRRDIASSLPANLGPAISRLGTIRRKLIDQEALDVHEDVADSEESTGCGAGFNSLVKEDSKEAIRGRRLRWLSQICEYWPLKRLAEVTDQEIERVLAAGEAPEGVPTKKQTTETAELVPTETPTELSTTVTKLFINQTPKIILAGSGPGHPGLLTRATHQAILSATLILADKLVPAGVLALIPRRTPVHIARKFPGNADAAQAELYGMAITGYCQGHVVLRLKQGDPYIYGRGGEEVLFFEEQGVKRGDVVVLPGITSALSAPLFAGIPATQRDWADQVLICTGTGKKGAPPTPPGFVASRTTIFLMALHRIDGLVSELTKYTTTEMDEAEKTGISPGRKLFPPETPCAVLERATCPDQRVMRTTLQWVEKAIEAEGSRPPGLLVVGRACGALEGVRETAKEGEKWRVEEGFAGMDVGAFMGIEELA